MEGEIILSNIEWVIEKNGLVWTDRIDSEDYCVELIEMYIEKEIGSEYDFTYRPMSLEEMRAYE